MWRCLLLFAACSSPPPAAPFHRDGGLQFETLDLTTAAAADLGGGDGGGTDGGSVDLLTPDLLSSQSCANALASLSWDFESGVAGFTHQAIDGYAGDNSWPFDDWQRGTPSGAGPGACHGGTQCFGTYLTGNYASCERAMLTTPVVDLSACSGTALKLVFWHWFSFWTDAGGPWYDGGLVEFSSDGGSTWDASGASYPGTIAINPSQGFGYDCLSPNSFYVDGKG